MKSCDGATPPSTPLISKIFHWKIFISRNRERVIIMGNIYYTPSPETDEEIKNEPTKPKSKVHRKRQAQIVIRISDEEKELLKQRIDASGKSQAEYLRQAVLNKKIINTDGVKAVLPDMKYISNNLNQLVKKINAGFIDFDKGEVIKTMDGLNEVWRLLIQQLK
jgi:hypothetical protein